MPNALPRDIVMECDEMARCRKSPTQQSVVSRHRTGIGAVTPPAAQHLCLRPRLSGAGEGSPMIEAALVSRSAEQGVLRARNAELAGQLRAAAVEGDDARIRRLLSELLRFQGLTKGQRVSLQLKALLDLARSYAHRHAGARRRSPRWALRPPHLLQGE